MYQERPKQIEAANELVRRKRALLTEDCGIGKTMASLLAAQKTGSKTYIVCPAKNKKGFIKDASLIGFTNYEICSWAMLKKTYKKWGRDGVFIVDEAHRLKTWNSERVKSVFYFQQRCKYLFLLSATPSQHTPTDWYWLFKLCYIWRGTRDEFIIKFNGGYYNPKIRRKGRMIIQKGRLTNRKMFKALINRIKIKKYNRKIKFKIKRVLFPSTGHEKPKFEETAKFRMEVGTVKLKWFMKLKCKPKGIFFVHHRKIATKLGEYLKCPVILGGMTDKNHTKAIKKALQVGRIVISLKAGGEAINGLDKFESCSFLELSYSPLIDRQAILRMVRDENDAEVNVTYYIARNEHNLLIQNKKSEYLKWVLK